KGWRTLDRGQWRIGREGWKTLNGGQWKDWLTEVEDTERRSVEGLAEGWRTLDKGPWRDWQRGVEETEWSQVGERLDT
ncbi:unnamed protein product, partial [Staurois parvus]